MRFPREQRRRRRARRLYWKSKWIRVGFCYWLMAFVVLKVGRAENVKGFVAWLEIEKIKYFSSVSSGK